MSDWTDSATSQTWLRDLCKKFSRAEFVEQHPWLWLVRDLSIERANLASFSTVTSKMPPKAHDGPDASELVKMLRRSPQQFALYPLRKSDRNPWKDAVLIGRARNVDVIVNDASVSKLHARVESVGQGYAIADVKSTNGTWVGDHPLAPEGSAVPIDSQSRVTLGHLHFFVGSSGDVYDAFAPQSRVIRKG